MKTKKINRVSDGMPLVNLIVRLYKVSVPQAIRIHQGLMNVTIKG